MLAPTSRTLPSRKWNHQKAPSASRWGSSPCPVTGGKSAALVGVPQQNRVPGGDSAKTRERGRGSTVGSGYCADPSVWKLTLSEKQLSNLQPAIWGGALALLQLTRKTSFLGQKNNSWKYKILIELEHHNWTHIRGIWLKFATEM